MNLKFTQKCTMLLGVVFLFLATAFQATAQQGDLCTDPIVITPGSYTVDTLVGTGAVGGDDAVAAKWYSYTPAASGFVEINSCGGGADTRLFVWTGGCDLGTNTLVADNDDFCEFAPGSSLWASQVNFQVIGGTEYLINWDDQWEASGFDFSLSFTDMPPDPTCDVPSFLIEDDIESYDLGDVNGDAPHWGVWTGATSSGVVSEDTAASGTQSIKIDGNIAGQDALLLLNDAATGHYWVGWKMFIPEDNNGYFNLQHDPTPGTAFAFEASLVDGAGSIFLANETLTFEYPENEWFDVILFFDIDNEEARLIIGDIANSATTVAAWNYTDDSTNPLLAAINFYPINNTYIYYVDDVAFALLPDAGTGEYCYTATSIDPGVHTVSEVECFGGAYNINDSGFAGAWFSYTPTEDGVIAISSCGGGADTRGWIFEGECHDLNIVGVNDDLCDLGNGSIWASYREAPVTAGNTYYIMWDDIWEPTGFDFELTFTAGPLNDGEFCQSAIPVSAGVDIFTETFGNGAVAGPNIGNFVSSTTPYAQSAWYSWTAPFSGTAEITSCDGGSDSRLWVYTGDCGGLNDLDLIASSDSDCPSGDGSFIGDWEVMEGTTYLLEWDNEDDSTPFLWRINYNTPQYTFNVDMNLETVDPGGVFIAGSFNGFTNTEMTDDDGDGIYTATVAVPANSDITYKFKNGPDGWETIDVSIGDDCTVGGFGDRGLSTLEEDETIDAVCFGYCVACDVVDVDEVALRNGINVFPNPASSQLFVQFDMAEAVNVEVRLLNTLGQIVSNRVLDGVQGQTIHFDVSQLTVGTYFIQFVTDEASVSQKVILQN